MRNTTTIAALALLLAAGPLPGADKEPGRPEPGGIDFRKPAPGVPPKADPRTDAERRAEQDRKSKDAAKDAPGKDAPAKDAPGKPPAAPAPGVPPGTRPAAGAAEPAEPPLPEPPAPPAPKPPRIAMPSPEDLRLAVPKAREVVRDVLKPGMPRARQREATLALLAAAPDARTEPAICYRLFLEILDSAVAIEDMSLALRVVDGVAEVFEVSAPAMKADALRRFPASDETADEALLAALLHLEAVKQAMAEDEHEAASRLVRSAESHAHAARLPELGLHLRTLSAHVQSLKGAGDDYRGAREKLEKDPTDTASAILVARYRALVRHEWDDSLPILAAGAEAKLKTPAASELVEHARADGLAQVGDEWHAYALSQPEGVFRRAALQRAAHWYTKAVAAEGAVLVKHRVEPRLKEIARSAPPPAIDFGGAVDWAGDRAKADYRWIMAPAERRPGEKGRFDDAGHTLLTDGKSAEKKGAAVNFRKGDAVPPLAFDLREPLRLKSLRLDLRGQVDTIKVYAGSALKPGRLLGSAVMKDSASGWTDIPLPAEAMPVTRYVWVQFGAVSRHIEVAEVEFK